MASNLKLGSTIPKTITQFLADLSLIDDVSEILSKLGHFRNRLEEEITKIHAFKRELPLSLLLINDAIKILKDEEMHYRGLRNHQPVLEEFMPLKKSSDDYDEKAIRVNKDNSSKDKRNWLSSAQLWNTDDSKNPVSEIVMKDVKEEMKSFEESTIPALSLVIPGMKNFKEDESAFKINGGKTGSSSTTSSLQLQTNSRKQRRCWSPELHRQFVNALQQLGGSHVATPKQIRDLMQVDGLTNDEVKSHLQKYRLHTRKALTGENRSMVLFMDQDQYSESSKQSSSQSASPHGPFDLAAATGGVTSLEEEEDEDEKSESYGWKIQVYRSGKVDV